MRLRLEDLGERVENPSDGTGELRLAGIVIPFSATMIHRDWVTMPRSGAARGCLHRVR